jgi:arylsulfatase A-like enzyme
MTDQFTDADLRDFEPIGLRPAVPARRDVRRASMRKESTTRTTARPLNVVLVVLESVGARWTSLGERGYETTPLLRAETAHSLVFDNFYAHIGRSSNSLSAMLLSAYPKLGFRDMTEEYPDLPGTSLATVFRDRGYRTGFITPSQLTWAGWDRFLEGRGFDEVRDEADLGCAEPISSWGVEDRCMVDDMLRWMDGSGHRPFFLMTWSQQTHHPYEPSPGIGMLDLSLDPVIDEYAFERYLNVLRETDRQIARVFEAVRAAGRARDTVIVVTGDHGQAFGYPHESFMQGRSIYEEDVRVPLMIWSPRRYRTPSRSTVVGSHVDLAPTIAELAGIPPAPAWQGRSLFDDRRSPRAYFYVAEDEFMLGVREGRWKYIFNVREGSHELFDLQTDPDEQTNVAAAHPDICARLRRHLAAWTDANRRQYLREDADGRVDFAPIAPGA